MLVAQAEPALLFIMAILVGTVIMGMLLSIFNLQELILVMVIISTVLAMAAPIP